MEKIVNGRQTRATKTGRGRMVPIAGRLSEALARDEGRAGPVVSWRWDARDEKWKCRALALLDKIAAALPDYGKRCRWNVFRHTFASLLVQAGVSIDKIAAWMGNSPEVCRRHYAQFTPRDQRDTAIDVL